MIFDLVSDFADVLEAMPQAHPRYRVLKLIDEATRRDVQFIERHPTTLFQCLWNLCWWYDCPEGIPHYFQFPQSAILRLISKICRTSPEARNSIAHAIRRARRARWIPPSSLQLMEQWIRWIVPALSQLMEQWIRRSTAEKTIRPWVRTHRPPFLALESPLVLTLRGQGGPILRLAISPDGKELAGSSADGSVQTWDLETGKTRLVLEPPYPPAPPRPEAASQASHIHPAAGSCLCYSPDACSLGVGTLQGDVLIWNAMTGQLTSRWKAHSSEVVQLALQADGVAASLGHFDSDFRVWRYELREMLIERTGKSPGQCFAFSPDRKVLAIGDRKGTLAIARDPAGFAHTKDTPQFTVYERAHQLAITRLDVSADGSRLATVSWDGIVRLWDVSGTNIRPLHSLPLGVASSVKFSRDGRQLAVSISDRLLILDVRQAEVIDELRGHAAEIHDLGWAGDSVLVTVADDGLANIWDTAVARRSRAVRHEADFTVDAIAIARQGDRCACCCGQRVLLWDVETGLLLRSLWLDDEVVCAEFSPDGQWIAIAARSEVLVWNLESRIKIRFSCDSDLRIARLRWSPEGTRVFVSEDSDSSEELEFELPARTGRNERRGVHDHLRTRVAADGGADQLTNPVTFDRDVTLRTVDGINETVIASGTTEFAYFPSPLAPLAGGLRSNVRAGMIGRHTQIISIELPIPVGV